MVSLHDSLVSSSARKMPIRMRPDLTARKQQYLGRAYWVVKDPVGLNYFRFQEEEFAILRMLDGETSLDEIKERFEAEFPPQKITLEELQQFLGMLHRSGLVIAGVGGQGRQLLKRRSERRRKEFLGAAANILCIRFKGFDPERFLEWLYTYVWWFFSRTAVVSCCLFALSALLLVLVEFDVFRSKLPGFHQFFSPSNAFLLATTLGLIKVLHEFGHGLTCKHFGGECHEMGVMILVLTPCLYCNVSDSWMLPSKWQRAAIGAAGIYVELVIASICTYLWWFTEPGLLNHLCLNAMFISSVSTVIFNANPLLRYDGYYILADIMEIPNLRQKATMILSRKLAQWCLGMEQPEDPFLPQRKQIFFALYSIAAAIYRWVVLFSILWFLYQIFKPYRLEIIGQGIIATSIVGLVVVPLYKVGKFFYIPGRLDKVKKPRMYLSLGILGVLVLFVVFVPLPHSVICPLYIQAQGAKPVYVDVGEGGKLVSRLEPGTQVAEGQEIAQLSSVRMDLEVASLTGKRDQYRAQLDTLRTRQIEDRTASAQIPQVEETLASVEKQLKEKQDELKKLRLVAPIAGTVLPPPEVPEHEIEGQLPEYSGSPLKRENLGAYLKRGTTVCQVGDGKRLEAVLVISQDDRDFVKPGQKVYIKLDGLPHDTLRSEITTIGLDKMSMVPQVLAAKMGGEVPTTTEPGVGERPQSACYPAYAPIDDDEGLIRLGLRGRARVYTAWQPLGTRLWRLVTRTFNFKL